MKNSVVFAFVLFVVAAAVSAFPTPDVEVPRFQIKVSEETFGENPEGLSFDLDVDENSEEHGVRSRRATCDLLSFDTKFGSLNHSACAAHCLAMRKGFKGGRCRDGVCHCRR